MWSIICFYSILICRCLNKLVTRIKYRANYRETQYMSPGSQMSPNIRLSISQYRPVPNHNNPDICSYSMLGIYAVLFEIYYTFKVPAYDEMAEAYIVFEFSLIGLIIIYMYSSLITKITFIDLRKTQTNIICYTPRSMKPSH